MNAHDLYASGELEQAISSMNEEVKSNPLDPERRGFLCELLCIVGNWERADVQLAAIEKQSAESAVGVALYRQLVRAAQWREQFHAEGRAPEMLSSPDAGSRDALRLALLVRDGQLEAASELAQKLEDSRPRPRGLCDGTPFEDLRDLDDITATVLEVFTSTGKYYWVPWSSVQSIELHTPQRPRDLLWLRASLEVRDGPSGEVYLPTIYAGALDATDELSALGRRTDWVGEEGQPVRGVGLRTWLVGEEPKTILEVQNLTVEAPGD